MPRCIGVFGQRADGTPALAMTMSGTPKRCMKSRAASAWFRVGDVSVGRGTRQVRATSARLRRGAPPGNCAPARLWAARAAPMPEEAPVIKIFTRGVRAEAGNHHILALGARLDDQLVEVFISPSGLPADRGRVFSVHHQSRHAGTSGLGGRTARLVLLCTRRLPGLVELAIDALLPIHSAGSFVVEFTRSMWMASNTSPCSRSSRLIFPACKGARIRHPALGGHRRDAANSRPSAAAVHFLRGLRSSSANSRTRRTRPLRSSRRIRPPAGSPAA